MIKICKECKKEVHLPITPEQYNDWLISKELIQHVFPQLNSDKREILISGICGDCYDKLFANYEEL